MKLFQCAVRRQSERDGRVNSEGLFLAVCVRVRVRVRARVRMRARARVSCDLCV